MAARGKEHDRHPGVVSATQVLEALVSAVPIEAAMIMEPATADQCALPGILRSGPSSAGCWLMAASMANLRGSSGIDSSTPHVTRTPPITIATGEQRLYANILLQIGVVFPQPQA